MESGEWPCIGASLGGHYLFRKGAFAMTHQISRSRHREDRLRPAGGVADRPEAGHDAHPDAGSGEIEQIARERRELMEQVLDILINDPETGLHLELPCCERCGVAMESRNYNGWTIHGLEGDTWPERPYYYCPDCEEQAVSLPAPETAIVSRPVLHSPSTPILIVLGVA